MNISNELFSLVDIVTSIKDKVALIGGRNSASYSQILKSVAVNNKVGFFIANKYLVREGYEFSIVDGPNKWVVTRLDHTVHSSQNIYCLAPKYDRARAMNSESYEEYCCSNDQHASCILDRVAAAGSSGCVQSDLCSMIETTNIHALIDKLVGLNIFVKSSVTPRVGTRLVLVHLRRFGGNFEHFPGYKVGMNNSTYTAIALYISNIMFERNTFEVASQDLKRILNLSKHETVSLRSTFENKREMCVTKEFKEPLQCKARNFVKVARRGCSVGLVQAAWCFTTELDPQSTETSEESGWLSDYSMARNLPVYETIISAINDISSKTADVGISSADIGLLTAFDSKRGFKIFNELHKNLGFPLEKIQEGKNLRQRLKPKTFLSCNAEHDNSAEALGGNDPAKKVSNQQKLSCDFILKYLKQQEGGIAGMRHIVQALRQYSRNELYATTKIDKRTIMRLLDSMSECNLIEQIDLTSVSLPTVADIQDCERMIVLKPCFRSIEENVAILSKRLKCDDPVTKKRNFDNAELNNEKILHDKGLIHHMENVNCTASAIVEAPRFSISRQLQSKYIQMPSYCEQAMELHIAVMVLLTKYTRNGGVPSSLQLYIINAQQLFYPQINRKSNNSMNLSTEGDVTSNRTKTSQIMLLCFFVAVGIIIPRYQNSLDDISIDHSIALYKFIKKFRRKEDDKMDLPEPRSWPLSISELLSLVTSEDPMRMSYMRKFAVLFSILFECSKEFGTQETFLFDNFPSLSNLLRWKYLICPAPEGSRHQTWRHEEIRNHWKKKIVPSLPLVGNDLRCEVASGKHFYCELISVWKGLRKLDGEMFGEHRKDTLKHIIKPVECYEVLNPSTESVVMIEAKTRDSDREIDDTIAKDMVQISHQGLKRKRMVVNEFVNEINSPPETDRHTENEDFLLIERGLPNLNTDQLRDFLFEFCFQFLRRSPVSALPSKFNSYIREICKRQKRKYTANSYFIVPSSSYIDGDYSKIELGHFPEVCASKPLYIAIFKGMDRFSSATKMRGSAFVENQRRLGCLFAQIVTEGELYNENENLRPLISVINEAIAASKATHRSSDRQTVLHTILKINLSDVPSDWEAGAKILRNIDLSVVTETHIELFIRGFLRLNYQCMVAKCNKTRCDHPKRAFKLTSFYHATLVGVQAAPMFYELLKLLRNQSSNHNFRSCYGQALLSANALFPFHPLVRLLLLCIFMGGCGFALNTAVYGKSSSIDSGNELNSNAIDQDTAFTELPNYQRQATMAINSNDTVSRLVMVEQLLQQTNFCRSPINEISCKVDVSNDYVVNSINSNTNVSLPLPTVSEIILPWEDFEGKIIEDSFDEYAAKVLSIISQNPGSRLTYIQTNLHFLNKVQTKALLSLMCDRGILYCRVVHSTVRVKNPFEVLNPEFFKKKKWNTPPSFHYFLNL